MVWGVSTDPKAVGSNPTLGRYFSTLSFFLYILPGARFRALSAGVHCTLRPSGLQDESLQVTILKLP